ITKRMAVVIRKYLIGTAKKYIGKGLKETLSNYVIDNALDTIEKIAIPDRVLEGYINDILQYILKQTNLVVRNFAELKEISKMKKQGNNTHQQNVPLKISNEQGRLPRTFERGFVARGTYNDQEITPPTHRFSKITLGKQDETENEAPPIFTSEPKETEK